MPKLWTQAVLASSVVAILSTVANAADDKQAIEFFEKNIRPVLVNKCYKCHSSTAKSPKGGLLLDTREGIRRGGESGHGVVPGNLDDSLILEAIRYESLEMPPDKQLPDAVIANFEKWVRMGAADPRIGKSSPIRRVIDFERSREFWAFQPIRNPTPPKVADTEWPAGDIDRFVLARMESKGLKPVEDADRAVLVRRVYFDLIGLPPTPEQVDDFVADSSPGALPKLIDRLLESPRFGERWGRHWLDVVRYGESTGMERNFTYPYAWRYRDYVISAFNKDKGFDQFILEQIAGDLLPSENTAQRDEHLIATGMLAIGPKSLNERDREKFAMDIVDEQIDVSSRAFLGLTASCARCHDHKFDPIPPTEYYSLAGIFRSTQTFYGTGGGRGNRQAGQLLALSDSGVRAVNAAGGGGKKKNGKNGAAKQLRLAQQRLKKLQRQAAKNPKAKTNLSKAIARTKSLIKRFQAQLKNAANTNATVSPSPSKGTVAAIKVMAVQDGSKPADTQVRIRGEANERGDTVPRGFLTIATLGTAPKIDPAHSGRMEFAQWLIQKDNPLTARVAVNRLWQHLFGRGIVGSVNNFGANGDRPSHPELLDHLATQFVEDGWSVKKFIRTVMLSRVYRLGGGANAKAAEQDPDNRLLWRMNQRRLEAEALRDAILAASGQLDTTPAKASVVMSIGNGDIGRNLPTSRFVVDTVKRSVYLPIVRGAVPEMLRIFDFPEPSIISGQRDETTVPTQALFMMNSSFVIEQSKHLAKRILDSDDLDDAGRVNLAYRLTLCRTAKPVEVANAIGFVKEVIAALETEQAKTDAASIKAWAGFCQVLFASSEFRYVD